MSDLTYISGNKIKIRPREKVSFFAYETDSKDGLSLAWKKTNFPKNSSSVCIPIGDKERKEIREAVLEAYREIRAIRLD